MLIVVLQRTRLGPAGPGRGGLRRIRSSPPCSGPSITRSSWSGTSPTSHGRSPSSKLPVISEIPSLLVPALSLAFVGLVQGAGVSAGFPNEDGTPQDESQDFVGQGAGNIVAGLFQGMPVGGSMSASSLVAAAGAKTRAALFFAAGVMAMVILLLGGLIELIAMPALAGLLIVVGVGTVKPDADHVGGQDRHRCR